jgi:hypothetical protein
MVKKLLGLALALGALYVVGAWLVDLFTSDETKIRRIVAGMEEAYNEGRPGSCVGPLAKDWRHEGHEIDRELLLGALFQTARDRDRETKELRTRVEVDEEAAEVSVDGERASLACDATLSRLRAGQWSETWRVHIEAELADGDDGWEIVESRHRDLAGTHLGR